ncbi:hypothetical protein D0N73_07865 [Pseudomonas fluorescens]|nr:hypothetical protein D0N73_07865 [Pseudomonas fluorescens]
MQIVVPRTCNQSCTRELKRESCQVRHKPGFSAGQGRREGWARRDVRQVGARAHTNEAITAGTC